MSTDVSFRIGLSDGQLVTYAEIVEDFATLGASLADSLRNNHYWEGEILLNELHGSYSISDEIEPAIIGICFLATTALAKGEQYDYHYFNCAATLSLSCIADRYIKFQPDDEPSFLLTSDQVLPALLQCGQQFIHFLELLDTFDPDLALGYRIENLHSLADEARAALVAHGYLDG